MEQKKEKRLKELTGMTPDEFEGIFKPVEIKTESGDMVTLYQVTPKVKLGDGEFSLNPLFCIEAAFEVYPYDGSDSFGYSTPILLSKETAKQVIHELEGFVTTPF